MTTLTRFAVVLLAAVAALLSTSTADAAPQPRNVPLSGTHWQLTASGYARTAPQPYTGSSAYFSVRNAKIAGNDGCNSVGGVAVVSGSHITFGPLASTKRACFAPGAQAEFDAAFRGTRSVSITDSRLVLRDGPRGYWVFAAQRHNGLK